MDPNIPIQPIQTQEVITQPVIPPAPDQSLESKPKLSKWIIVVVVIIFLIIASGATAFFLNKNQNTKTQTAQAIPTQTVAKPTAILTPTPDPTANWKTFSDVTYSIQYPTNWVTKKELTVEKIYDPNSMQSRPNNGVGTIDYPTKFVNIMTVITSTDTSKQYADRIILNNPAYTGIQTERRTITVNGLSAEIYKEAGEGSMGYDIAVSNGSKLIVLNIPIADPTTDLTINKILSTFKFISPTVTPTQQYLQIPRWGVKFPISGAILNLTTMNYSNYTSNGAAAALVNVSINSCSVGQINQYSSAVYHQGDSTRQSSDADYNAKKIGDNYYFYSYGTADEPVPSCMTQAIENQIKAAVDNIQAY